MECQVCMEAFDAVERRPKVLPCGHTFCLRCLQSVPARCPLDSKVFETAPEELLDNFMVLQHSTSPAQPAAVRLWCLTCNKNAVERCADEEHSLRSLKKARSNDSEPLLAALRRDEAGLEKLGEALGVAVSSLDVEDSRAQLQKAMDGLVAARERLQGAAGAGAAVWEQAKRAAEQDGLSRSAAQLAADLVDPSVSCSVTVRRGEAGDVAWRGEVRPAEDAAASLLLCRLACRGALQQEEKPEEAQVPSVWVDRPNEGKLTVEQMADRMKKGSRVGRGRDWEQTWTMDGTPPGLGTITRMENRGRVGVTWDCEADEEYYPYSIGSSGLYRLRLLAGLEPSLETPGTALDVKFFKTDADMDKVFKDNDLDAVRSVVGLNCGSSPVGSHFLLQRLAPYLEGLQMVAPEPRHLDVVVAMPHLQALSLTDVSAEQLRKVVQMPSLRRLELHCRLDAPLPVLALPAMGLRWLRCGVYPLSAALALVRANADSLEELQLVAASDQPYGCPDLAAELKRCGLKKLRRLVLVRVTAYGDFCRHHEASCQRQMAQLYASLECEVSPTVICSDCSKQLSFGDCANTSE